MTVTCQGLITHPVMVISTEIRALKETMRKETKCTRFCQDW